MAPRITTLIFAAMMYGCGSQSATTPTALPAVPTSSPAPLVRTLQPLRVTGRIIDSAGSPVAGANVTQWDTTNRVASDSDGAFDITLAVSAQDRSFWLTVEKVGFETSELNRSIEGAGKTSLRLHEIRTISVGESLHSVIKSDDSACGYHWGYLCRRTRLIAPASGTLTVDVVPETATRVGMLVGPVGFPQAMEQRLTMTVNAGSEVVVETATEWSPTASAGFALSTSLSPAKP